LDATANEACCNIARDATANQLAYITRKPTCQLPCGSANRARGGSANDVRAFSTSNGGTGATKNRTCPCGSK
jgi:hypothetical protein